MNQLMQKLNAKYNNTIKLKLISYLVNALILP